MGLTPPEPRQDERFNNKWIVCTSWFNTTLDSCEPIPLTPEILTEWCKFVELWENRYQLGQVDIWYDGSGYSLLTEERSSFDNFHHLHQLQHLYSALTQTVLTVKIK